MERDCAFGLGPCSQLDAAFAARESDAKEIARLTAERDEALATLKRLALMVPLGEEGTGTQEEAAAIYIHRLLSERDALRAELIATLRESVGRVCYVAEDRTLDTLGLISTYADQLRRLAELGQVDIISDDGRRVIARWRT